MQTTPAPPVNAELAQGLNGLATFDKFQQDNASIFPSIASLRWFYRTHREELLRAGAVIELAGRLLVNGAVFATKALEIGRRVAASRAPGKE